VRAAATIARERGQCTVSYTVPFCVLVIGPIHTTVVEPKQQAACTTPRPTHQHAPPPATALSIRYQVYLTQKWPQMGTVRGATSYTNELLAPLYSCNNLCKSRCKNPCPIIAEPLLNHCPIIARHPLLPGVSMRRARGHIFSAHPHLCCLSDSLRRPRRLRSQAHLRRRMENRRSPFPSPASNRMVQARATERKGNRTSELVRRHDSARHAWNERRTTGSAPAAHREQ